MKPVPDFENDPGLTSRQRRRRREYYADRAGNIRKTAEWQRSHRDQTNASKRRHGDKFRDRYREQSRVYAQQRRTNFPEEWQQYQKSEAYKASVRRHYLRLKEEVIKAYGGHCACCGETKIEFLSMDHIYNDGAEERRNGTPTGRSFYRWLKKNGFPQGRLQVLCHNCNGAKGYYGYCPHELEVRKLLGMNVYVPVLKRPKLLKKEIA